MENASKALLMAAGVLISVLVLSLAIFLYVSFNDVKRENMQQMEQSQISGFNSKYTAFDGQTELTYYDILNVTNMARENNRQYGLKTQNENNFYIAVFKDGVDLTKDSYYDKINNITQENLSNNEKGIMIDDTYENPLVGEGTVRVLKKYTCKVELNDITGRVWKITFFATS